MLDDVVDGRDVRMRHACRRARLVKDARPLIVVAEDALERDAPPQARVAHEKHLTHRAAADRVDHHVGSDARAGLEIDRRRIHDGIRLDVRIDAALDEQGEDLGGDQRIGAALADEAVPLGRRQTHRRRDDILDFLPGRRVHR